MSAAACAPEADGELAGDPEDDDDPPAGAEGLLGAEVCAAVAAVVAGVVAGGLLDDPHAVASNARQAAAPAVAIRRMAGE